MEYRRRLRRTVIMLEKVYTAKEAATHLHVNVEGGIKHVQL